MKLISYTRTFGSTVVIRMYVAFQDMDLKFVFCYLYCNVGFLQ